MTSHNTQQEKPSPARDGRAPEGLVISLVVGLPFLAALLLQAATEGQSNYLPAMTMTALLVEGLTFCFYWRRVASTSLKDFLTGWYVHAYWLFMASLVVAKLVTGAGSSKDWVHYVCLGALGAVLVSGCLFALLWTSEYRDAFRTKAFGLYGAAIALVATLLIFGTQNLPEISEKSLVLAAHASRMHGAKGQAAKDQEPSTKAIAHDGAPDCEKPQGDAIMAIDHLPTAEAKFAYRNSILVSAPTTERLVLPYAPGSHLVTGGESFELSELSIGKASRRYQLGGEVFHWQIDFVHRGPNDQSALISLLVKTGKSMREVERLIDALSKPSAGEAPVWNAYTLLPSEQKAYTLPAPCDHAAVHLVMAAPIEMSESQLTRLTSLMVAH